ncbi:MAG TPA: CusA/CzcA family heavy metal efflux RND transporter [Saprospiraceae bacterium]|nr:CusA/CzcA family heavy metal efflux RND transporter [Saprospiraceae bacterium]
MLNRIIQFSLKNKLIIGLLTIVLVIWGGWSATKIPIDAVPDITNNQVQIITVCPTLAGQEVEQQVTFPIEQSIANLPDIEETRSISRFGLSTITVVFKDDVDIYFARQLINEKLKEAEDDIPKGIGKPEMGPVSTGLGEIYQYILHPKKGSEEKYSAMDLRSMQDWIVARQFNGTEGIAEVNGFGGELKQYEVAVNPNRLKAMGVSIADIFNALEKNNQNTGGAYIDKKPHAYFIRGIGLVTSLEDIRNIAVKDVTGSVPIFIEDVAEVRFGSALRYGAMTYNGEKDAVGGVIMMLKGANSAEVVNRIKAKIPSIQKSLPDDVVIEPFLDRTDLVKRAMGTVERNLLEGALIVIFVLVLFLGNLRAGLIVASAIPLSMLFALGLMNVFGVSANLMSLGAIDFGLIVDGAVIIVESTLHVMALRKEKVQLSRAEMDGVVEESAEKMMNSAAFGQIIILIVYFPILTMTGIEGKMFVPMAQTISFAILGALILSLTYIPVMSSLFLSRKVSQKPSFSDRMMDKLTAVYQPLLDRAIRFKYWVVFGALILFGISLLIFSRLGGEFIPQLQEGDFAFHCILPQGSSLSQSIETSMQASRILKSFDEVRLVVGKTGSAEVPVDPMPPEVSDMMIILKPKEEWKEKKTYAQLANEMMEKLEVIPGIFFEANQPIQMRFNELMTGIRQDVAIKIFGENMDTLTHYAEEVSREIKGIKGVTTPVVEQVSGLPQINVVYDRVRMANYGLNIEDINDVLSAAFAGKVAGQVLEDERRYDLVVRLDTSYRHDISDVSDLMIPTPGGLQIPLSQVATIGYQMGPAQISREDGKRRIVIGFNVMGRDVKSVVTDIEDRLGEKVTLPVGYYVTFGGQFENLEKASQRLMVAVPAALLLIFILLFFAFHSFKQAILVYTAIPMSAIGGIFALVLRDMPFSISAGIGFIALFGVAVLNGIVLIGTFNLLEKSGIEDVLARVKAGTKDRLRPVLMTATVASLGFLPMALSQSSGAEVQKPLATVVIGGLISATFLTLFLLPLLYILFNYNSKKKMKTVVSLIIVLFSTMGLQANAQSVKIKSPEEAVQLAIKNNAELRSKEFYILQMQSQEKAAIEIPKTEFAVQIGQYSSYKFDNSFQVSQSIPYPTVFKARRNYALAEVEAAQVQRELSLLDIKGRVRISFYQIQFLLHQEDHLRYLDSLYEESISIAQVKHKTGDSKRVDISTMEARRGEISLMIVKNNFQLEDAYTELKALLNTDNIIEVVEFADFKPLEINVLVDSMSIAAHPVIQELNQEVNLIDKKVKVTKAESLPEFTLNYTNQSLIGYQQIGQSEQYYDGRKRFHFVTAGIAIPLSRNTSKAKIRSLEYNQQSIEAAIEQKQWDLKASLSNAIRQYKMDVLEYQYYHEKALDNANEIVTTARLGYKTGDTGYLEYLHALQDATSIRLNYLESIDKINKSVIHIYSIINQ